MKLETTLARLILDVHENPGDPRPLFYLARQYVYLKQWDTALETFGRYFACSYHNDDIDAYSFMGQCCEEMGKYAEALQHYLSAIAIRPTARQHWYSVVLLLKKQGRLQEAAAFAAALALMPEEATGVGYISQELAGYLGFDRAAIELYHAGETRIGRAFVDCALDTGPKEGAERKRIETNATYFREGS